MFGECMLVLSDMLVGGQFQEWGGRIWEKVAVSVAITKIALHNKCR